MAVKGAEAKDYVEKKIKETFGDDFICVDSKKIYVWSREKGERKQVAISLSCPSVPIEVEKRILDFNSSDGGINFDNMIEIPIEKNPEVMITEEEEQAVLDLMARLGL